MKPDVLKRISASVAARRGWDFSSVREDRDPVPWIYEDVVRRFLQQSSHVLDIGTGGGERFLALASALGTGVGVDIDPAMIQVAREDMATHLADRYSFLVMDARALGFPDSAFDVVLNRHSTVHAEEIGRILRPEGFFITQQVGARNYHNICSLFGCGPGGQYDWDPSKSLDTLANELARHGCSVVARAEYDVRCWFCDLESLVFTLQAIPIPQDFDMDRHWPQVAQIISEHSSARGIETNEHRELLVAQKLPLAWT